MMAEEKEFDTVHVMEAELREELRGVIQRLWWKSGCRIPELMDEIIQAILYKGGEFPAHFWFSDIEDAVAREKVRRG
ncbi:MAG: hypothetical protein P4L79_10110 [Legionella sp.]|uniref:hypothetical protein n=1 Tax=Legionella sp. TaxID=459 RepID=UPI002849E1CE|nr:hypothetical protein [Legionella sp.]